MSRTDATYVPDEGDLIWTDLDPTLGREQSGRRPAIVLSPTAFFEASRFAIVCPITRTVRAFGSSVLLPDGLPVSGEILTSHVRSIDAQPRPIRHAGAKVPAPTLAEVRRNLATLCGWVAP
ncbi:MAG: type II toxin-antitoxin system PemK/MazF family toxin [Caulobacteraceae bacterium]